MTTTVTALLVSHDGERWLPAVLDGLTRQTRQPDRVVAVDTGSSDTTPRLLRDRLGDESVLEAAATSSYGAAVTAGLSMLPTVPTVPTVPAPADDEWVWLLHDDSAPAPDALERLLGFAAASPAAVLGPQLREWPDRSRLLEVGVTITGTGRRETGLEPDEYDQGQHDRPRDVLAVNTAGMLVRRPVLDLLGFDPRLPVFGADLDFGWRASRAGYGVLAVPDAVVFHVEAAHRGIRRTPVTGSLRRGERAAALYILLVNGSVTALPFRVVRLFLGSLLRALGLLLVRAPGEAVGEVAALGSTYLRPMRILAGRRSRRHQGGTPVRHLLAPAWLPYRHGLDVVSDLAGAAVTRAGDRSAGRRTRARDDAGTAESGPVAAETQNLPADGGLPARLLSSPVAVVLTVLVVAALVGARGLVGAGMLSGGALLPAPDSTVDWWHSYLSSGHDIGTGSSAPAAPYLVPLAVAGTALLGEAWLVVDVLFLLAVPLAAWGAYRFLLRVTSSPAAGVWGAVAYGVLPVVTGAVQQGRLGTVAGTIVLPWLAHAALFLRAGESEDRRVRAGWRTALWLAVLTAFVPVAWVLAAAAGLVAVGSARSGRVSVGRVLVPLLASLVLLLPWTVATWSHHGISSVLFEAGLPAPRLTGTPTRWDVLTGRPGDGAPGWMSLGVLVAAVVALLPADTRRPVLRAWVVVVLALAATSALAAGTWGARPPEQPPWLGFPLVVAQAAGVTAAALAGAGIRGRLSGASFGWRQPVGVVVVLLAVLTPVVSAVWWVWSGSGGPLDRARTTSVPTYMTDAVAHDPAAGILVVRGSRSRGFSYVLLRQAGLRLGDDSVMPSREAQAGLTRNVANLATDPDPSDVRALSERGIAFVFASAPADPSLVGNLDGVSGVSRGSAGTGGSGAWQLEASPGDAALARRGDPLRPWLLLLQATAVVVVLVLAAPTRRAHR